MGLRDIFIFTAAALAAGVLLRRGGRGWFLLLVSALAVYWLQPLAPIRYLDFWLPTLTLGVVVLSWALTVPAEERSWRKNAPAAALLAGVVLLVGATRFFSLNGILTAGRPPLFWQVLAGVLLMAGLVWLLARTRPVSSAGLSAFIILIILVLAALKLPALTQLVSAGLRALSQQSTQMAAASDLRWLGFSYVAFRLIHTLRDRQNGRLPAVSLQEYVVYMIFFPAFTAGPIDRMERFIKDLRKPFALTALDTTAAGQRLALGLFKKFIIADCLGLAALNAANALQVRTGGWMWLMLYAYAFQIFFDFSGYTDIAIGLGRLLGFTLPENFNAPYLKANLTLFWNNWHMTLTQWFRAYYFNPLTRWLRSGGRKLSVAAILFITQITTFMLIGLWHGITWNFIAWGIWHGLGLFVQNRYSEWVKPHLPDLSERPRLKQALGAGGIVLTFHYVALGWVWFALPSLGMSWQVFLKLFGMG